MNAPQPEWMLPPTPADEPQAQSAKPPVIPDCRGNREALIELEKQDFEIAFETLLEHLADGLSFNSFCTTHYHTPLAPARFRAWIYRAANRRKAYEVAIRLGTDAIEDEMIRIADGMKADGTADLNDTQRATLMIHTRKWILGVRNREKYGDIKRVDSTIHQTTTLSAETLANLSAQQLNEKVIEILGIDPEEFEESFPDAEAA